MVNKKDLESQSLLERKMEQSEGERHGDRGDRLNRLVGEGLSEKVVFEQRLLH